jgi:hypothetical protein
MSEERRKRQQEHDRAATGGRSKEFFICAAIVILVAAAYFAGWYHKNYKYDAFAQCLSAKQAKMYGLSWCPHCVDQKEMFGAAFHYVPYVECGINATKEETPECKAAGLKLFPSWQFGSELPKEGVLSLERLSEKTGCRLP